MSKPLLFDISHIPLEWPPEARRIAGEILTATNTAADCESQMGVLLNVVALMVECVHGELLADQLAGARHFCSLVEQSIMTDHRNAAARKDN